ncbi:phospholipid/cholesterol/gamma-HCH transport system permease protein [Haloechinothrix alba]|uniref:Phospholipid/cholesterol/gamma-HCH transport system permease protein n=1 Tax=Haloechinothrix alba TaxID=664784 RepID=A0A239A7F1_9PSEU|nr:ABC transporter permease [Haloechinothrix alba]SNR91490.1 phospholipid/cholesterol/gamma-HCH transport system permease protein [Haloechinothrix alba]
MATTQNRTRAGVTTREAQRSVAQGLESIGRIAHFTGETVRSLGKVRLYSTEAIRQVGVLISSSALFMWALMAVFGVAWGTQGSYLTEQFGAPGYAAIFPAYGGPRAFGPLMWGWILAAKVGCGLVAQIGSMRISEEIDALKVTGVRPIPYLVGTRLVAAWVAVPFLYITGTALVYLSSYVMMVHVLGTVSHGGFLSVLWAWQSPADLIYSVIWGLGLGTSTVLVGCYYGYNAQGGPAGVGLATAKSMVMNLVMVSVLAMFFHLLFWGQGFANIPAAN